MLCSSSSTLEDMSVNLPDCFNSLMASPKVGISSKGRMRTHCLGLAVNCQQESRTACTWTERSRRDRSYGLDREHRRDHCLVIQTSSLEGEEQRTSRLD